VERIEDEMVSSEGEEDNGAMLLDNGDEESVMPDERESRKRGLSMVSTQSRQGSLTKKVQLGW